MSKKYLEYGIFVYFYILNILKTNSAIDVIHIAKSLFMENRKNGTSDAELVESAKIDPEKFGLLIERYHAPLFHYIRRITQYQKEEVEDILQEIFIKMFKKLNEYNEELKFSSWTYRIAHNHIIDHFRKENARPRADNLEENELARLVQGKVDERKNFEAKNCADAIRTCISNLPMKYREVLVLRFIEEKNYEEIMDILKKPKGSVATLISRGREVLSAKMKADGIDCF